MFVPAEIDFGLSMLRYGAANESLVVSPVSVIFVLAMLQAGAKGTTKSQINSAIASGASDSEIQDYYSKLLVQLQNSSHGVKNRIANGFFLDKEYAIRRDYEEKMRKNYEAKIQALDFKIAAKAAKTINDFISGHTGGRIHDMVKEDALEDAHSLIVNAIHFSADWHEKFSNHSTIEGTFYRAEGDGRKIKFMEAYREYRLYAEDDEVQVLSLPYVDRSYAFTILLPKKRFGLSEIRGKLTGERVEKLLSKVDRAYVTVTIPKMNIETDFKLKKALISMGVSDMFGHNGDLSGITEGLQVSQAAHRAIIEVDEDGTTAAAATHFSMVLHSLKIGVPIKFRADHPFLFILTKDKNPLFIGQFM